MPDTAADTKHALYIKTLELNAANALLKDVSAHLADARAAANEYCKLAAAYQRRIDELQTFIDQIR